MAASRQATGSILSDVGDLYKRLLNHRPVIQNEVHFFLKEFELKREDSGLRNLQEAMKYANEMDTIFLEEITASSHRFKQINSVIETVNGVGGQILDDEASNLGIPKSEQEGLDRQVEECRRQYHEKQDQFDSDYSKHVDQLKEEIQTERDAREKLRPPSQTTSVGSGSVTIFPPEASSGSEHSGGSASPQGEESPTRQQGAQDNVQRDDIDSEEQIDNVVEETKS